MCAERSLGHAVSRSRAWRQRGLSLVELMVGIVISLLVALSAAGSAMMFSASQRAGIGAGGGSLTAGHALGAIKADAALAGLGFFAGTTPLCNTLNLSVGSTPHRNGAAFGPATITRDGDNDILDIMYASTVEAGTSVVTAEPSNGTDVQLMALLPVAANQTVLLAPPNGGGLCLVRSVTAVTAATNNSWQTLAFGSTGSHNGATFSSAAQFGRLSRAALIGAVQWNRYRVTNGNLVLERPLAGTTAVLVRNVEAFRVQYGVTSGAAATALDSWTDATGGFATMTVANQTRIRALRVGVMVRSSQREKTDDAGNCVATATAPQLFGSAPSTLTGTDTGWRCFRFRTSVAMLPLRNFF